MKTMTKIALLLTVLAAGNSAVAQKQELRAGIPHLFTNITPGGGGGTITYQWFRDGQPIAGATDSVYILLDYLAYGTNVVFTRGAVSSSCPGNIVYSPPINVAFGLRVDTVYWASVHIDNYQTFATRPDMNTRFYQWNRNAAWAVDGDVVGWPTSITDPSWTINPCPAGWRLPTQPEYQRLHNTGSTWADAGTRGNAVAGRFYGPNNATCSLPNNMYNCVFFPASGYRSYSMGSLNDRGANGYGWSSTQVSSANGYYLGFGSSNSDPATNGSKAHGFPVRCVR